MCGFSTASEENLWHYSEHVVLILTNYFSHHEPEPCVSCPCKLRCIDTSEASSTKILPSTFSSFWRLIEGNKWISSCSVEKQLVRFIEQKNSLPFKMFLVARWFIICRHNAEARTADKLRIISSERERVERHLIASASSSLLINIEANLSWKGTFFVPHQRRYNENRFPSLFLLLLQRKRRNLCELVIE